MHKDDLEKLSKEELLMLFSLLSEDEKDRIIRRFQGLMCLVSIIRENMENNRKKD